MSSQVVTSDRGERAGGFVAPIAEIPGSNSAGILTPDVMASNGVVHVIGRVLLP